MKITQDRDTPNADLIGEAVSEWKKQFMKSRPLYERAYRKAKRLNELAENGHCSPEDARLIKRWYATLRASRPVLAAFW